MKLNNTIYLTDDTIYVKNKKRNNIIKYKINKNIILYGKVYNIEKFTKVYSMLLSENKLNNNLFGDTIKIIINPTYTPADIFFLKTIFEKFNYRKIVLEQETKKYKLNQSNAYLNIFDNYLLLSYIDEYKKTKSFLIPNNYFNTLNDTLKYIKNKIANKDLYLIGKGEILTEIFNSFEKKYQNKTYIYKDSEVFLLI